MDNRIFQAAVAVFAPLLGAPEPLVSGNGVRFKSGSKGKATVYHSEVAPGNQAEIAFHVDSMATRLRLTAPEFRSLIEELRSSTGRPVEPNAQHKWPRVGLSSDQHLSVVVERITSLL